MQEPRTGLDSQPSLGIRGPTSIALLKGLNLVWGIDSDYMHAVLEGVTKQITELWLTSTGEPYYIGDMIRRIDARLRQIRPPIFFTRLPPPISERGFWKAIELRSFLLFYALP